VGRAVFDKAGIMLRGMIIRLLILPGLAQEAIKALDWIKDNLPEDTYISIMSQYTPYYKASEYPEINRRITRWEYEKVLKHFYKLGFENGYVQEKNSAEVEYIPDFNLEGV
jgi:putative pyruvate formate lyase activating enzyme